jgi:hypothetical protein
MISSTSSADRMGRPELIAADTRPSLRRPPSRADDISTSGAAFLRAELARQPEIRADVVERARALAADPSYPPLAVVRHVAGQILGAPDLSEIE